MQGFNIYFKGIPPMALCYLPWPAGLKQQGSQGKGATMTNLGSGDSKEGDKTKILFKSHLLLGNGGFIKLKTTNGICSGTQHKKLLGNTLMSKECPYCKKVLKGMPSL